MWFGAVKDREAFSFSFGNTQGRKIYPNKRNVKSVKINVAA
jgi:hypothetical protein